MDITFWGRSAEVIAQYCSKGSPLHVEGRLHQESWHDRQDGKKRTKLKVVGEAFQFVGSNGNTAQGGSSRSAPSPAGNAPEPAQESEDRDQIPF